MPPFLLLVHNCNMQNYEDYIAIIGAGISGLALGCILKKADIPVIIFEKSTHSHRQRASCVPARIFPVLLVLHYQYAWRGGTAVGLLPDIDVFVARLNSGPLQRFSDARRELEEGSDSRLARHLLGTPAGCA